MSRTAAREQYTAVPQTVGTGSAHEASTVAAQEISPQLIRHREHDARLLSHVILAPGNTMQPAQLPSLMLSRPAERPQGASELL